MLDKRTSIFPSLSLTSLKTLLNPAILLAFETEIKEYNPVYLPDSTS